MEAVNQLSLTGIDGQHLWGFLTAIGSLRLLDEHARASSLAPPRLAFKENGTAVLESPVTREQLASVLLAKLRALQPYLESNLGEVNKPSNFTRSSYETIALQSVAPTTVDLLAGLACVVGEKAYESTLCAANGASRQNLVQTMRDVLKLVEEEHVRNALFESWSKAYQIPPDKRKEFNLGTRKPTLRLDPSAERLYALRSSNPTTTDDFATEIGAEALAIAAFALLPVVPGKKPVTVASVHSGQRVTFSWPLWNTPATLRTVRSLVWEGGGRPKELRERDVFAAFSADRVFGANGKLSFAPSQGVWYSQQRGFGNFACPK
jgi:hypothetical protein